MKRRLSVCLPRIPIWGMKWKRILSVCHICQHNGWNETVYPSVGFASIPISGVKKSFSFCLNSIVRLSCVDWGFKWNVGCPSGFLESHYEEWNETYFVRLSVINANIMGEMKHSFIRLLVLRRFQYRGWKKVVRLSKFYCSFVLRRLRVKWNVGCPSVFLESQYEEWNETYFVRLS